MRIAGSMELTENISRYRQGLMSQLREAIKRYRDNRWLYSEYEKMYEESFIVRLIDLMKASEGKIPEDIPRYRLERYGRQCD